MTEHDLAEIEIEDLIPHRGNMILIDHIVEIHKEYAVTEAIVKESWPLLTVDGVQPLILVELAAQSAGVCNGWDRIKKKGLKSDSMGWLVGVKKAKFNIECIPLRSKIITRSENSSKYDNLRVTSSVSWLGKEIIGEITLQLFQAPQNDT
jgi:predicted hotdog family 3-hydroxylacyl-ACP dehydratase